jgi:hypothetical protein
MSGTVCQDCSPGKYFSVIGATSCDECPKHSYTNLSASTWCTPCLSGKYSFLTGATTSNACRPQFCANDPNWKYSGDGNFYHQGSISFASFWEAQDYCSSLKRGSRLAIFDQASKSYVASLFLYRYYHIGLRKNETGNPIWNNGVFPPFSYFFSGDSQSADQQNCYLTDKENKGQWITDNCVSSSWSSPAICQVSQNECTTCPPGKYYSTSSEDCFNCPPGKTTLSSDQTECIANFSSNIIDCEANGWVLGRDMYLQFIFRENLDMVSWNESRQICQQIHPKADLAILNDTVNYELAFGMRRRRNAWIGLYRDDSIDAQLPDQYWTWVDGTHMDMFAEIQFSKGHPNSNTSRCAGIYHDDGIVSLDCSKSQMFALRDTIGYSPLCSIPRKSIFYFNF